MSSSTERLPFGLIALLAVVLPVFIWSLIAPLDGTTWAMEAAPVLIVVPLILVSARSFPLTPLLYALIAVHALILLIGAHYTYAEMPMFNWLRDAFEMSRNHYDRVGHFAQGFIPAIAARELLLRRTDLRPGGWLFAVIALSVLGISAAYELIEWGAAEALGSGADAFLATQGDVWDTQKDMALALIGAIVAQALLSRVHDRQMARL